MALAWSSSARSVSRGWRCPGSRACRRAATPARSGSKAGKAAKKPGFCFARSGSSSERRPSPNPSSSATSAAATPRLASGLTMVPAWPAARAGPATQLRDPVRRRDRRRRAARRAGRRAAALGRGVIGQRAGALRAGLGVDRGPDAARGPMTRKPSYSAVARPPRSTRTSTSSVGRRARRCRRRPTRRTARPLSSLDLEQLDPLAARRRRVRSRAPPRRRTMARCRARIQRRAVRAQQLDSSRPDACSRAPAGALGDFDGVLVLLGSGSRSGARRRARRRGRGGSRHRPAGRCRHRAPGREAPAPRPPESAIAATAPRQREVQPGLALETSQNQPGTAATPANRRRPPGREAASSTAYRRPQPPDGASRASAAGGAAGRRRRSPGAAARQAGPRQSRAREPHGRLYTALSALRSPARAGAGGAASGGRSRSRAGRPRGRRPRGGGSRDGTPTRG